MLMELNIENFAVIENINLKLDSGLTVLSGEEGSGKSLIVDAIGILLGSRAPAKLIRNGKNSARVEGVFALAEKSTKRIAHVLKENDIEPETDGMLVISRDLNQQGRSVSRINGHAVPTSLLKNISRYLVDIHGQLDYISLLDIHHQMVLLDAFGNLEDMKTEYSRLIDKLKQKTKELSAIDNIKSNGRLELLKYQIDDIVRAQLIPGEEEELHDKLNLLQNSGNLKDSCSKIYDKLYGEERSVTVLIHEVMTLIKSTKFLDANLCNHKEKLDEYMTGLEDMANEFQNYAEKVEFDLDQLDLIEQRLNQINTLKRKYGASISDILRFQEDASKELDISEKNCEQKQRLQEEIDQFQVEAGKKAADLSQRRHESAISLNKAVNNELSEVGLTWAKFETSVFQEADSSGLPLPDGQFFNFTRDGVDKVEFMISTNPNEPMRPLRTIVSGGETSRIMLSLKSALKKVDPIPTLVFDEIDAGVGGRSGDDVGKKLSSLARQHQVICITHLPQIACFADSHLKLNKALKQGRAVSTVENVNGLSRVEELAAMLGSNSAGKTMVKGAEKLVDNALSWKNKEKEPVSVK